MELKRIIARDSRAANDKAIQLYGPDVLVISSQRVDNQTELIVAIDTDEAAPSSTPANAPVVAESPVTPDAPVPSKAQHAALARFGQCRAQSVQMQAVLNSTKG